METKVDVSSTAHCKVCKQDKLRTEFQRSTRAKNGLQPRCRSCQRVASAAARKRSREERSNPRPHTKRPRTAGQQKYCEVCVDYFNNNSVTCPYCRTEKACKECDVVKPLSEFYAWANNTDGHNNACIKCFKDNLHHGRNYGLKRGRYKEMLASQGGVCAICKRLPASGKRLHVDHDHASLVVRGLLCIQCNHGLGNFRDNIDIMRQAISYLEGATSDSNDLPSESLSRFL